MRLKAGDVSATDLEYNRQDMLSPAQSRRLWADSRQTMGSTAAWVIFMIVTVLLLTAHDMSRDPMAIMIVLPIALVVGTAAFALSGAFRAFRRAALDVASGRVERFASPVILTIQHSETKTGRNAAFIVLAGERHFVIDEDLYHALRGGIRYVLYVAPRSGQLLALEPEEDYQVAMALEDRHTDELTLGEDGELVLAEEHEERAAQTLTLGG